MKKISLFSRLRQNWILRQIQFNLQDLEKSELIEGNTNCPRFIEETDHKIGMALKVSLYREYDLTFMRYILRKRENEKERN